MGIKPRLNLFDTTMIVVSLVVGIGIFRTPSIVAGATRTPELFFAAWILGGFVSLLGALTFAEIGSRFPKPGAYYKVVAECYHSALSFMLNWANVLIVGGAGAAAVATIGAEYLVPVIFHKTPHSQLAVQLTAAGMTLFLFLINYVGIKTGAWAQNILTVVKIGMIVFLGYAAFQSNGRIESSIVGRLEGGSFIYAVAVGLIPLFYTHGGYQGIINFGGDVLKVKKNMPRAIFIGIGIIIGLYLLINTAYYRVLGIHGIVQSNLVAAELARTSLGNFGYVVVSLAIFLSAMGFLNVNIMQTPRSYFAMAEDRVLPMFFRKVNERTQVQVTGLFFYFATIMISIFFLGTFEKLVNYVMFIDSLTIATVASTIFVLRWRSRPTDEIQCYKVPLFPVLPGIFIIFLLIVSINVLVTETLLSVISICVFFAGYPLFLLMRRTTPLYNGEEVQSKRSSIS
jgi:APA family basic amino acid/polyamine antiporter